MMHSSSSTGAWLLILGLGASPVVKWLVAVAHTSYIYKAVHCTQSWKDSLGGLLLHKQE